MLATRTGADVAGDEADGAADPEADGAADPDAAGEPLGAALTDGSGVVGWFLCQETCLAGQEAVEEDAREDHDAADDEIPRWPVGHVDGTFRGSRRAWGRGGGRASSAPGRRGTRRRRRQPRPRLRARSPAPAPVRVRALRRAPGPVRVQARAPGRRRAPVRARTPARARAPERTLRWLRLGGGRSDRIDRLIGTTTSVGASSTASGAVASDRVAPLGSAGSTGSAGASSGVPSGRSLMGLQYSSRPTRSSGAARAPVYRRRRGAVRLEPVRHRARPGPGGRPDRPPPSRARRGR